MSPRQPLTLRIPGARPQLYAPGEGRPIPRDGAPERSLERRKRTCLSLAGQALGVPFARSERKDPLVRALGHRLRDPDLLAEALPDLVPSAALRFLGDLVLARRILFDDLPLEALAELAHLPGIPPRDDLGVCYLHLLSFVFVGLWDRRWAIYVPEDVRRPYAQALLALLDAQADADDVELCSELRALVARTEPPRAPWAPGLPTARARRRLETPGPDRVLELDVEIEHIDVAVRRRLLVSYQRPLGALHEMIRMAFCWPQRASHWFISHATSTLWAPPRRRVGNAPTCNEWQTPIRDALATRGALLRYVIDEPTHWVHAIRTRAVHAPSLVPGEPRLIDACGPTPPPEFYARRSYAEFLDGLRRGGAREWDRDLAGPEFDPDAPPDLEAINERLAGLA